MCTSSEIIYKTRKIEMLGAGNELKIQQLVFNMHWKPKYKLVVILFSWAVNFRNVYNRKI